MNTSLDLFCAELAELVEIGGDRMRAAIDALEIEANTNPHAANFLAAVTWVAEQERSPVEKLTAMMELSRLRGRGGGGLVQINTREFSRWLGWTEEEGADQVVARN
jgi:hypothetical protein